MCQVFFEINLYVMILVKIAQIHIPMCGKLQLHREMTHGSDVTQNTKHTNGNNVTQNREQQKYLARKFDNSVRMCVETPTPWRNDKWERCDTRHKTQNTQIYLTRILLRTLFLQPMCQRVLISVIRVALCICAIGYGLP